VNDRPALRVVGRNARCPICGRPADPAHRPFCSRRCADVDLGRWLKESYRVPADERPVDDDNGKE
jgi:endogenous inhibitor of DNA gyrase (YacG/DUF329 family)